MSQKRFLSAVLLLFVAVLSQARAATTYYWTNGSGNSSWNDADLNWTSGGGNVAWVDDADQSAAVFDTSHGALAGMVTVDGTRSANSLTFSNPGYTLSGGTVLLGGASPNVTAAANATITSALTGSNGLVKNGSGTLTLGGPASYSGATVINQGVVKLQTPAAMPWTPPANTAAYYTFDDPANLFKDYSGNGNDLKIGGGTADYSLFVPPQGTHNGSVVLGNNGFLVTNSGAFPTNVPLGNSPYTIAAWINMTNDNGNDGIVGWGSWGTGKACNGFRTGGNFNLINYDWNQDTNRSTAPTSLFNSWNHVAVVYDPIAKTRTLYLNGAQLGATHTGLSAGALTANNFRVGSTNNGEFFFGNMADLLIVSDALTPLQVQSAMAGVGATGTPLPTSTALQINAAGTLDLNGVSQTVASLAGAGTVTNSAFDDAVLTLAGDDSTTFSGTINDGATNRAALVRSGSGSLLLSGSDSNFSGGTTLNGGTLALGADSVGFPNLVTSGPVGTGILALNGGTLQADGGARVIGNTVTVGGNFAVGGEQDLELAGDMDLGGADRRITVNNTADTTFSGALGNSGGGFFMKDGTGTLQLTGVSTINARLYINRGEIVIGGTGSLTANGPWHDVGANGAGGTSAGETAILTVKDLGSFSAPGRDFNVNEGFGGTGIVNLQDDGVITVGNTFLSKNAATTGIVNQTGGTFTVNGTLNFGANGGGNGIYNLNGGTLVVNNIVRNAGSAAALNIGGGTLRAGAAFTTANNFSITINSAGATIDTGGFAMTMNGPLAAGTGSGGLTKNGFGTLTLNAVNTYTGGTTISADTLALGPAGSVATSPLISVGSEGIFDVTAVAGGFRLLETQTLAGAGSVLGNVTSDIGAAISPGSTEAPIGALTFNGDLSLDTAVLKFDLDAPGVNDAINVGFANVLSAANTTALVFNTLEGFGAAGAYQLISFGSTTALRENFAGPGFIGGMRASYTLGDTSLELLLTPVVNAGWDRADGGDWNNASSWSGGIVPNAQADIATLAAKLQTSGTVALNTPVTVGAIKFDNAAAGYTVGAAGGTNTLTMDNGDSSAAIDVLSGNHAIAAPLSFSSSTTITVAGAEDSLAISGAIDGIGGLTKLGSGALTLSGACDYFGPTVLNGGTLRIGEEGSLPAFSDLTVLTGGLDLGGTSQGVGAVIVNGGTVENGALAGSVYLVTAGAVSAALSGDGVMLTKNGPGAATLSGANTFSGGATLNAGTLALGTDSTGSPGEIANGPVGTGTLTINGGTIQAEAAARTIANAVSVGGNFAVGGEHALTLTGDVNLGGADRRITVAENANLVFAGTLSNSGGGFFTKDGAGTLTVTGAATVNARLYLNRGEVVIAEDGVWTGNPAWTWQNVGGNDESPGGGGTRDGDTPTLTVKDNGRFLAVGHDFNVNEGYGGTGTVNIQDNGAITVGNTWIAKGAPTTGIVNQTGGTFTVNGILRLAATGGTATYNLDGGTLVTNGLERGTGTAALNFGGGTLKAGAPFTVAAVPITVNEGGATIDTNGHNVTLNSAMAAGSVGGGLTKAGPGTLTVSQPARYDGPTVVSGGVLKLQKQALPANTVAYYAFNDPGNLGLDSSINANTLAGSGAPQYSEAGKNGGALNLDGASMLVPASPAGITGLPTGNNSYTIAAWMWLDPTAQNASGIVGWGNYGADRQVVAFRANGPTQMLNYWWGADLPSNTVPSMSGAWHHVACTADTVSNVRTIYIDGVARGTDKPGINGVTAANFTVGRTAAGVFGLNELFKGQLDDVLIANRAFSVSEIQNLMNSPIAFTDILPTATAVRIEAGAALDLNEVSQVIGGLSGPAGAVIGNSGFAPAQLTFQATTGLNEFAGVIRDGMSSGGVGQVTLAVTGGELTLSGHNSYSAGTIVSGGTLIVAGADALPSGHALTIGDGGTVVLAGGIANGGASAASAQAVPEPGTLLLLAVGLLAGLAVRRRAK